MEKAANLSPKAVSVMGRLGKKATVAWYQALASLELRKQSKQIVTIDDHEVAKELEEAGLLIPYVHKRVKVPGKYVILRSVAFASWDPTIASTLDSSAAHSGAPQEMDR